MMKKIAMEDFFVQPSHQASSVYLSRFPNLRSMLKKRPRVRFDGIYILKHHYVRSGDSDTSEYKPTWDVFSYSYLKFYPNGKLVQI